MTTTLVVERFLASTLDDHGRKLWRTEWCAAGERVGVTAWVSNPARAVRDGEDADHRYRQVIRRAP